jgi:carbonic anhydrase
MAFSWEPFGRTQHDPEPARETAPAGGRPKEPARQLAILTCMDCRIDPLAALGLRLGDAVVLRNAGAQWSEDVQRSLVLAQRNLGVTQLHVLAHTDCAAHGGDDEVAQAAADRSAARLRAAIPDLRVQVSMTDVR